LAGHTVKSADIFEQAGLRQTRKWRSIATPEEQDGPLAAARLRDVLARVGGLHAVFAQFLGWRADLMGAESVAEFRRFRLAIPPLSVEKLKTIARRDLGAHADELIRELEPLPLWSTISRTAWRTNHQGIPVVVQIARDPVPEAEVSEFEKSIQLLNHPDLINVTRPEVLAEFRAWLRQGESLAQEHRYLVALGANREKLLVDYPLPIAEISTTNLLVWPWVEGEPVMKAVAAGSVDSVCKIAVAVLEQFCGLSLVDGDFDPDMMVITPLDRLAIRRLSCPAAVPANLVNLGMKYVASVLAGETTLVAQSLVALASGVLTAEKERRMINALSAVEPELKIRMWFPGMAAAFESNWKALAKLQADRPLFLDLLHRNLVTVGYWNADAVIAGAKREDAIEDAQWPVVSSLLRGQLARFKDTQLLSEWSVGAGLLMFGAMRESTRIAEELRDNNLTFGVETREPENPLPGNRGLRREFILVLLLLVLVVALRYGIHSAGAISAFMSVIAVAAAGGLFWVVSKIR